MGWRICFILQGILVLIDDVKTEILDICNRLDLKILYFVEFSTVYRTIYIEILLITLCIYTHWIGS